MVVYFTGTGNSRHCAKVIAQALGDELTDSTPAIRSGEKAELHSDKPWVFVGPIYAWQMAHIFTDFIRSASLSGNRSAYFVLTCGGDIGAAGKPLEMLCREKQLDYMGTLEVVMPDNYIVMFPAPEEDEIERLISQAQPVLQSAAQCIRELRPFPVKKTGFVDRIKSGPINMGFSKYAARADKFCTSSKCVSCGKCADICPLCNITVSDGKPVWGKNCTHCMACISSCPAQAIEYGKSTIGKRRYYLAD